MQVNRPSHSKLSQPSGSSLNDDDNGVQLDQGIIWCHPPSERRLRADDFFLCDGLYICLSVAQCARRRKRGTDIFNHLFYFIHYVRKVTGIILFLQPACELDIIPVSKWSEYLETVINFPWVTLASNGGKLSFVRSPKPLPLRSQILWGVIQVLNHNPASQES